MCTFTARWAQALPAMELHNQAMASPPTTRAHLRPSQSPKGPFCVPPPKQQEPGVSFTTPCTTARAQNGLSKPFLHMQIKGVRSEGSTFSSRPGLKTAVSTAEGKWGGLPCHLQVLSPSPSPSPSVRGATVAPLCSPAKSKMDKLHVSLSLSLCFHSPLSLPNPPSSFLCHGHPSLCASTPPVHTPHAERSSRHFDQGNLTAKFDYFEPHF